MELAKDNQWWYARSALRGRVEHESTILLVINGRPCRMTHSVRGRDGRPTRSFKFEDSDDRYYWTGLRGQIAELELGNVEGARSTSRIVEPAAAHSPPRTTKAPRRVSHPIPTEPSSPGYWPATMAHADWSIHAGKRWMVTATLKNSLYSVSIPTPVEDVSSLTSGANSVVGFDFPIGVPAAYALLAGITDFSAALRRLGTGRWSRFYDVAEDPSDIALDRPFYPMRPGGTSRQQLLDGLGLADQSDLLRVCERKGPHRAHAASPLFWTLGGQQVGKAAITGWRDVIRPALNRDEIALWPFDGPLTELLASGRTVVVETYPADACAYLGMSRPGTSWSKRNQLDRAAWSDHLLEWARKRPVQFASRLVAEIQDGFRSAADGEDRFDALVGMLAMIEVVAGFRELFEPAREIARVEGWMFGMSAS